MGLYLHPMRRLATMLNCCLSPLEVVRLQGHLLRHYRMCQPSAIARDWKLMSAPSKMSLRGCHFLEISFPEDTCKLLIKKLTGVGLGNACKRGFSSDTPMLMY